jgi:hypothetical protein
MTRNRTGHSSDIDHDGRKREARAIKAGCVVTVGGRVCRSQYEITRIRDKFNAALGKFPRPSSI